MLRRAVAAAVVAAVVVVLVWPGHLDAQVTPEASALVSGAGVPDPYIVSAIDITQVLANVLLFVPVGLAVAFASRRWWTGAVVGLVVSAACEAAQTAIPTRVASLADVAANTVGAVLGPVAVLAIRTQRRRSRSVTNVGKGA